MSGHRVRCPRPPAAEEVRPTIRGGFRPLCRGALVFAATWLVLLHHGFAAEPDRSWPTWLGPQHNGITHESGWSVDWPTTGLPVVWQRQIGIGFSSMSIVGNQLYTMGHVDGIEHVYCLNAVTGELIWSHDYPSALVDNLHDGGPGATPTVDEDRVFTLGREGLLHCLDASSGEVIWSKELQSDLGMELPEWGFSSSAYILGRQLILEAGRVVSYDKMDGTKNWQSDRHIAGYGSAIDFEHDGTTMLATLDCDGLRVVQAVDGDEVAFVAWKSPFRTNSTTPIVRGDEIYISSGYNVGCGLFRIAQRELELVYSNADMRNHFNNSILWEGYLYGFDGNSNLGRVVKLTCMKFETGEVAWSQRGFGCGSLLVADGKLLILSEDGQLVVAQATPDDYNELARSQFLDGRCWTVPVLLNGLVYGRNAAGDLVCVQLPVQP